MNREIKFRGKSEKTGKWVYGYLLEEEHESYILYETARKSFDGEITEYIGDIEWIKIIPETAGQYIGLKDKNKKEIYDGDIVQEQEVDNFEVIFRKGCFCYKTGENQYHIFNEKEIEVIGNKFENKDLLK